jgi:hypothetical protein
MTEPGESDHTCCIKRNILTDSPFPSTESPFSRPIRLLKNLPKKNFKNHELFCLRISHSVVNI